ncbi:hypothetical protein HDU67_001197 [Dinochytrium kinnereticum]|nr:hypothetical protein HDU67_001197 [Dinochytrium kinnereticum]
MNQEGAPRPPSQPWQGGAATMPYGAYQGQQQNATQRPIHAPTSPLTRPGTLVPTSPPTSGRSPSPLPLTVAPVLNLPPLRKFPSATEIPKPELTEEEVESICMRLSIATRGVLTDSSIITLTQVCAGNPPSQMARIAVAYKRMFAASLSEVISTSESSLIITACTMAAGTVAEADAIGIFESLKGLAVDYDAIYEVLLGRTNDELAAIRKAYLAFFDKDLDKMLSEKMKSSVWKVFKALIQGDRKETAPDQDPVRLADDLRGLCKSSSPESFAHMLATHSVDNLRRAFDAWSEKFNSPIDRTIIKEFGSDVEKPLLVMVSALRDPVAHLASHFQSALSGLVSNQAKLVRLVVRFRFTEILGAAVEEFDRRKGAELKSRLGKGHVGRFLKVGLGFEKV